MVTDLQIAGEGARDPSHLENKLAMWYQWKRCPCPNLPAISLPKIPGRRTWPLHPRNMHGHTQQCAHGSEPKAMEFLMIAEKYRENQLGWGGGGLQRMTQCSIKNKLVTLPRGDTRGSFHGDRTGLCPASASALSSLHRC